MNVSCQAKHRGALDRFNIESRVYAVWLGVFSFALLACIQSKALDPSRRLSQYGHSAWRVREGYFSAPPLAIAQTQDGQLWIGGESGLVRFDGVQFLPWKPPEGVQLPDSRIFSLLGASDGSLWIGTGSGLARWRDGKLTVYAEAGRFAALLEDRHGIVWAGHTRALDTLPPLCRFAAGEFRCYHVPDKFPLRYVGSLHEDLDGNLWVGGEGAVCRWQAERPDCYPIPGPPRAEKWGVYALARDSKGEIWADAGPRGVWRMASGRWQAEHELPNLKMESEAMLRDREGSLWIGDVTNGIIRRVNGKLDRFTQNDGLSGDRVNKVFEDREGNIWLGTSGGLDRFRDLKVVTLAPRHDLPLDSVWSVVSSQDGSVWIGGVSTLVHLNEEKMTLYESGRDLPGNLGNLFEDHGGRLWVGIGNRLFSRENDRFHELQFPTICDSTSQVRTMAEEVDGTLWVGTTGRNCELVRMRGNHVLQVFPRAELGHQLTAMAPDPAGGLWLGLAGSELKHYRDGKFELRSNRFPTESRNMFADAEGLWAATNQGLAFYKDGNLAILNTKNGLPCDSVEAVIRDRSGAVWLKSPCAIVQIPASEVISCLRDPGRHVQLRVLDAFDGVQAGLSAFDQHAARSTDGRLWFAIVSGGLQVVDPSHLVENAIPPPVKVVRVVADHQNYDPTSHLRLPPLTRDLEIAYTAFSYTVPEKVRFRYRLEGADLSWEEAGNRRVAFFANLKPGTYRFHLVARNNDGVWSSDEATLDFLIPPVFYQTTWFRLLMAAFLCLMTWSVYRWRIRQVRAAMDEQAEIRLSERTRIAQELHDTLLQGVLSATMQLSVVNDQLKDSATVKPLVERVVELLGQVVEEGRIAVYGLRLSEQGMEDLDKAFSRVPQELAVQGTTQFQVLVEGDRRALHPVVRDEVYRIGRESLANAFRHSGATNIEVALYYSTHELRVLVRDNGKGIRPEVMNNGRDGHWGLSVMRERADKIGAKLRVWSNGNGGTQVDLRVPGRVAFESGSPGNVSKWLSKMHASKESSSQSGK